MTTTLSRLYDSYSAASQVVTELEAAGLPHSEISLVASNADNWYSRDPVASKSTSKRKRKVDRDADGVDDRVEGAQAGAGIGAALGGSAGLLAGLGLLAIPGIGPVVAAGWLLATAAGAAAGGTAGGLIGALTQAGASEEHAELYAEGVRRGGALVTARVPDGEVTQYKAILDRVAVNIHDRADAYRKSGWSRFDPAAPPYTAEQARRERETYP